MKQAYNIEKMTLICQPILSVSTQEEFMNLQAMVQSSYSNSEFNHDSCELTDLIMEMEHIRFEKEWMQFVLGGDMSGNTSGEYVQGQMPYIQNIQFIVKKTCSTQPLSKLPEYAPWYPLYAGADAFLRSPCSLNLKNL